MLAIAVQLITGHTGLILKAARLYKKGQPKEEGELATCNEGGTQAEFVGALKEVFGKPKEFVHVDLDVELSKLGLKNLFPLDLDCGDGSVLFLPAMHGQWFELAQHAQKLVRYVSCAYNFLSGRWSIWSAVRFRAVVNIWTRKV